MFVYTDVTTKEENGGVSLDDRLAVEEWTATS